MKTAVITGASSGLGKETAKALAAQGWHVIAHGRDSARSALAEADIREGATARVDFLTADLCLLSDTAKLAGSIARLTDKVDVLLNNAGGMRAEFALTSEGNEVTFAGNHLGHFLLTKRLMPLLEAAPAARIINTSSDAANYCRGLDWDDLQSIAKWDSGAAYCVVKLYNILFARELAKRGAAHGIVSHAFHPGVVDSNFVSHAVPSTQAYMATLKATPADNAAEPLVWLATSAEAGAVTGLYWNKAVAENPNPIALDDAATARLWDESEALLAKSGFSGMAD